MDTGPRTFFLLGLGCGAAAALTVVIVGVAIAEKPNLMTAVSLLREWQTLLAGLFALAAAVPTIFVLNEQIRLEQKRAQYATERKQFAAKTSLPVALGELVQYIDTCVSDLRNLAEAFDAEGVLRLKTTQAFPCHSLPISAARTLEACLETASEANADALATILRKLQIQNSRLQSLVGEETSIRVRHTVITFLVDALEIRRRVEQVFPYARGECSEIDSSLSASALKTSAFFRNLREEDWPGLSVELDRRANQ